MMSRRAFFEAGAAALTGLVGAAANAVPSRRGPLGLPVGLQLYTVRPETGRDLTGTLRRIAEIGYEEVELAGYYGMTARDLRSLLNGLGLAVPSTHHTLRDLVTDARKIIDYVAELGCAYLVVSFPDVPDRRFDGSHGAAMTIANSMTLHDWNWVAEQLNRIGALSAKAGIRTGYHNHNLDFRRIDGVFAYDQLVGGTDPGLVTFELDVGWVVGAGQDPLIWLAKYRNRISMLHIKDVKRGAPRVVDTTERGATTELGRGQIDWKLIFEAAPPQLAHYFVEQEQFERPIMESVRMDYDHLHGLALTRGA